jgi:hypothetical protein
MCFLTNGKVLKMNKYCSWHGFPSYHTNEEDFLIVGCMMDSIPYKTNDGILLEICDIRVLAGISNLLARIAKSLP